jgi:hypothetical protein
MLVEQNGDGLQLTPVGRERYLALPNSAGISDSDPPDELVSMEDGTSTLEDQTFYRTW